MYAVNKLDLLNDILCSRIPLKLVLYNTSHLFVLSTPVYLCRTLNVENALIPFNTHTCTYPCTHANTHNKRTYTTHIHTIQYTHTYTHNTTHTHNTSHTQHISHTTQHTNTHTCHLLYISCNV